MKIFIIQFPTTTYPIFHPQNRAPNRAKFCAKTTFERIYGGTDVFFGPSKKTMANGPANRAAQYIGWHGQQVTRRGFKKTV